MFKSQKRHLKWADLQVKWYKKIIMIRLKIILCLTVFILLTGTVSAEVKLPRIFGNHMVLQRDKDINLWGWAEPNEQVTISFKEQNYSTVAGKEGEWNIELPAQKAGGPCSIEISGTNTIQLENILFGDVWVCSGQSNMYFRTQAAKNSYKDLNEANFENIRLFQIEKDAYHKPKDNLDSGEWLKCNNQNVKGFSAVAYFFGRDLHKETDVPIGLIHASWGGSNIQAWMDGESIKQFDEYVDEVNKIEKTPEYFQDLLNVYKTKGGDLISKQLYKKDNGFTNNGQSVNESFLQEGDWKEIAVPGYWEDLDNLEYDGTVWYRKQFELPVAFYDKDLVLNLGWIDDYDYTFFNGKRVGQASYKGSERKYDISADFVRKGINEIVVCVYDSGWKGGFWGPRKPNMHIKNDKTLLKVDLRGLWEYKRGLNLNELEISKIPHNSYPQKRSVPTFLYNAMLAPIANFAIKGAIWYQGESNARKADEYARLLPAMITGWRKVWNQPDFPFLVVQLANYGAVPDKPQNQDWPFLREAQYSALALPNTGLATTIDLGNEMDIHPTNKQEVGRRLMLSALKNAYKLNIVASGPSYKSHKIQGNKIIIEFENIGSGLITTSKFGYLNEFAIAGNNGEFVWAKAYIQGDKVVVYSDKIINPVAVRYAWSDNPSDINFYNAEGLPAIPFRTDK